MLNRLAKCGEAEDQYPIVTDINQSDKVEGNNTRIPAFSDSVTCIFHGISTEVFHLAAAKCNGMLNDKIGEAGSHPTGLKERLRRSDSDRRVWLAEVAAGTLCRWFG